MKFCSPIVGKTGTLALLAIAFLSLVAGCSQNTAVTPPQPAPPASPAVKAPAPAVATANANAIAWQSDFEAALKEAHQTQKPVMIDFYADWCGACKHLDANIYTAAPVIAEAQNFISVKVDTEKRGDLSQKFGVSSLPTIVFLDAGGNTLSQQAGAPQEPELFVQWMREARSKASSTPA